jgi:hypothetical protein
MIAVSIAGSVVRFKFHSKGRHHIPRQKYRVFNWRDYDAALRNRGSLTIWFTEEALGCCHVVEVRVRQACVLCIFKLPRAPRATCSSLLCGTLGAFELT